MENNNVTVTSSSVTASEDVVTNKRSKTGTSVRGEDTFTDGVKKKALQIRDGMYGDSPVEYHDIQIREGDDPDNLSRFEWSTVDAEGKVSVHSNSATGKPETKEINTPASRELSAHVRDAIRRASFDKKYTAEEVAGLEKLNHAIVDAVLTGKLDSEAKEIITLADSISPSFPKTKLSSNAVEL